MVAVKNISTGPRGIRTTGGELVMLEAGQSADLDLADGEEADDSEWFEFGEGVDEGLSSLTVAKLKALAEAEGIDLGDATKKDDIIAAIELAREDQA